MRSLMAYHLISYIKSYNYVAPMSFFIIILVVNYSIYPNPVLASYGVTSIYLYIIAAWITVRFFHTEDLVQQQITMLHAKNEMRYFCSKYVTASSFVVLLALISTSYPIVCGMFSKNPTVLEITVGFFTHFLLGLVAVTISVLFSRILLNKKINSWLGLSLVLVISIVSLGVETLLPGYWKYILLVLPPVSKLALLMKEPLDSTRLLLIYLWIFLYAAVMVGLFAILYRHKKKFS